MAERERERERERGDRFMHSPYPLFVSIRDQINPVRILNRPANLRGEFEHVFEILVFTI